MKKFRLGTRASQLALWQAEHIASSLEKLGYEVEIVKISTTGDKLYNANLALIGGKGLFLKELEEALSDRTIDFAVHSMKDVPAKVNDEFIVHSVLEREDPRDAFLSIDYVSIQEIPAGKKIGTSSSRRASLIRDFRADLACVPFRGNVNTRLEKLKTKEVSGCILALAGLKRLKLENCVKQIFSLDEFVPAVTQGILSVEYLKENLEVSSILEKLKNETCEFISTVERAFMGEIEGNCTLPAALNAEIIGNEVILRAAYFCTKSSKLFKVKEKVAKTSAFERSKAIAREFKSL